MTVKLGLVGTGWWATFSHIPTAQADGRAEVVAIADLNAERLNAVGNKFGIARRYANVHEMLANEKLDGVIVSTPHVVHKEAAIPVLEAGVHALIEKPLATTAADARAIVRAAEKAGKEVFFSTTPAGRDLCAHYRQVRESCLIETLKESGLTNQQIGDAAQLIRNASGLYDTAARAAASL